METTSPLFSVIIPTYNRAQLVGRAIQSVLDQDCKDWELLVVDDGSTDNTKEVVLDYIKRVPQVKYFYQKHQERSTARNRGIEEASGKYICFLDDDDYYLSHHLSTFKQALGRLSDPWTILRTGFIRKKDKISRKSNHYHSRKHHHPVRFAAFHFCSTCTLCIPRIFLLEDDFPPAFRHWQDTHLILRLLAKHPFYQLPALTYVYFHHSVMGSQAIYTFPDARDRIQNNIAAIEDLFSRYGQIISPFLPTHTQAFLVAQKYMDHAHGALHYGNRVLAWELFRSSIRASSSLQILASRCKFILKALLLTS